MTRGQQRASLTRVLLGCLLLISAFVGRTTCEPSLASRLATNTQQARPDSLQLAHRVISERPSNEGLPALPEEIRKFTFTAPSPRGLPVQDGAPQSVEDLELSDLALITTVDGSVHAVLRATGQWIWTLHDSKDVKQDNSTLRDINTPLVRVEDVAPRLIKPRPSNVKAVGEPLRTTQQESASNDEVYIIEPHADGDLYIFLRSTGKMQKLPLSMHQLVEMSPFTFPGDDSKMFVGKKETKLVGVDIKTGNLVGVFGPEAGWCEWHDRDRPATGEDPIDARPQDLLYMGKTDYTVSIFSKHQGLQQQLSYSAYGPSTFGDSIQSIWTRTPDDRYLQPMHDGSLVCFKAGDHGLQWTVQFDSPAVSVFDIATPRTASEHEEAGQPLLFAQPQPRPAFGLPSSFMALRNLPETTFVGNHGTTYYAMSRDTFPLVAFAPSAHVTRRPEKEIRTFADLIGSHRVESSDFASPLNQIEEGEHRLGIDPPQPPSTTAAWDSATSILRLAERAPALGLSTTSLATIAITLVAVMCAGIYILSRHQYRPPPIEEPVQNGTALPRQTASPQRDQPENDHAAAATVQDDQLESDNEVEARYDDAKPRPGRRRKRGRRPLQKAAALATAAQVPAISITGEDGAAVELAKTREEHVQPLPSPVAAVPLSTAQTGQIGSLIVSESILGYGSHGTVVLRGEFQGRAVAVKRLLKDFVTIATHEVSLLQESDDHTNVIRYFCKEQKDNFLYIALELCPASLADLIEQPSLHPGLVSSFDDKKALRQITSGLVHLHSLKIVHRDIKPQNILVAPDKLGGLRMMISDFGLCKKLDNDESSYFQSVNHAAGSFGYRAPEVLRGEVNPNEQAASPLDSTQSAGSSPDDQTRKKLTRSVDIFALGNLFYYILTRGEHPFGARYEREVNILKARVDLSRLDGLGEEALEAQTVILSMISPDPLQRPKAKDVLVQPFFWSPAKRLLFVCDASDRFEIMERDPPAPALQSLERSAPDIVGDDWLRKLDRTLIDNLGKYRKYEGHSVRDLLRVLRNKKNHFQDLPENVQKNLGALPDGFLAYFTHRFPRLLLHIHQVVREHLIDEPMFGPYFSAD
ncbi:uncharacterized protein L969DRAFT_50761 [Mixia osmundae IAM 14324]|uniref:non-specific serine/threonine protein kinase n=1 Tax=Mixia osmundae (strain CBS 9802 / IAM 14324 / JCM 22182 / KY 12970) TaxID=764103 RepID=G7DZ43_MIXOS|nr:uncharacterized protein L969DRAFT_50761 [Mixia osmundae IAM 14324]KEI38254.1 hypothetical protein L969DRAFT_50761 [Mixia osmundae IAM 14324]GAA95853.1 hypothetical protein E5Q_02510 [Mixia osmundae IAM 14324]